MNLPVDQLWEPEILISEDLSTLRPRTQKLYKDWLLDLRKGRTFFGLNWNVPTAGSSSIDCHGHFDTYVFSWHVEPWQHDWIKEFCLSHPDSQVIIIGEYPLPDRYFPLPNLRVLVYHCWDVLFEEVFSHTLPARVALSDRKHRLSCLTNKPSYFKSLTLCHLLSKHNKDELIYSHNVEDWYNRSDGCRSLYLLEPEHLPRPELTNLYEYYHNVLKHQNFVLEKKLRNYRFTNYDYDNPAYDDCLVNVSNETYGQSLRGYVTMSGPFITEKTWKTLLSGTALLVQGQNNTYSYLENFGFKFDYPWSTEFDKIPGDIDRFLSFLKSLDSIFDMDQDFLCQRLEQVTTYNYQYIRSQEFFSRIKQINQTNLSKFFQHYK
jgi:hypothetical protein